MKLKYFSIFGYILNVDKKISRLSSFLQ